MKRGLVYRPAAQKALKRLDQLDAARVVQSLEHFALVGRGDVKALKGEFKGQYRLRVGKLRVFFRFEEPNVVVLDIDNRGESY